MRLCEAALQRVTAVDEAVGASKARMRDLESAILAKAFRGELVPQDPNDEPASVLLERIRAERAARETTPEASRRVAGASRGARPPVRGRRAKRPPQHETSGEDADPGGVAAAIAKGVANAPSPRLAAPAASTSKYDRPPRPARRSAPSADRHVHIDDFALDDLLFAIRRILEKGGRDRETLIRDVARELGFSRTGAVIHDRIHSAINTASRRAIVKSERGTFTLYSPTIEHYSREELKDLFLSAIRTTWWEQNDAIRAVARYLGFRRTGEKIEQMLKSAIASLIREKRLERQGAWLRRA